MNFYCLIDSNLQPIFKFAYSHNQSTNDPVYFKDAYIYNTDLHKVQSNEKITLNKKTNMYSRGNCFFAGINLKGEMKIFVHSYLEFELKCHYDLNKNYKHLLNISEIEKQLLYEMTHYPECYKYLEKFIEEFPNIEEEFDYIARSDKSGMWI